MKTLISEYKIGSKIRLSICNQEIIIAVREHDKEKGSNMCSQCIFGEPIIDTSFSGQRTISGYCCGLTVTGKTNCSSKERSDKKDIVYKRIVKK